MSSPALPLSDIVNVIVLVAPQAPIAPTFNQGLIIGPTNVIPSSQRVRKYTSVAAMLTDGYLTSSPEYIAAGMYFGQLVPPQTLWVGRQDLTSIATFATPGGSTGTGFVVGDVVGVTQGAASGAALAVTAVGGSGQITGLSLVGTAFGAGQGTGYSVANGLAITGGHGSGATLNILSVGDTPLQAVTYCRTANTLWWGVMVTSATTADHQAIAPYIQTAVPAGCYFYATADAAALAGTAGNVFSFMRLAQYNRVFGIYTTTQGGAAPNNVYAAAAAMGVAMGLNTGLANSYFTLWGKTLVGILPEPVNETQIAVVLGNNGNLYLGYANAYFLDTFGKVGSGQFLDEILNLDMLVSAIQYNVMNVLTQTPSVPMTDAGETILIHAVNQAAQAAQQRGFIATGVWQGVQIINLFPGDSVPGGYRAQAFPFSTQTQSDRQARKAMPIYLAIIEAGAVQSLLVGVYVQR